MTTNIKKIGLFETSIGELELSLSFLNLGELCDFKIWECRMLKFSSNIFIILKHNDKLNSTLSSKVKYLDLKGMPPNISCAVC